MRFTANFRCIPWFRGPLLPQQLKTEDLQLTPRELVVFEEDPQVLYGALGVFTELRDIAAEGLRPLVHQTVEGVEQNAVREQYWENIRKLPQNKHLATIKCNGKYAQ